MNVGLADLILYTAMKRLDTYLYEKGLAPSREKARALIMAGLVKVGGRIVDKPGFRVKDTVEVEVLEPPRFVSRGGYKLENLLEEISLNVKDFICLDVGASTGGFTDCLLQRGAKRVYTIDVGKGQLHPKIREDRRVIWFEKLDARDLTEEHVKEKVDLITVDVSFISVTKILPRIVRFLKETGLLIVLVKPQFEVGPKGVKKGIVKDPELKKAAIRKVVDELTSLGLKVKKIVKASPKGVRGNEEFFIVAGFKGDKINIDLEISGAVAEPGENRGE